MQTSLSFFQNLLSEWYQFTLDNLDYAVCLAVSVWLLTVIFYSLRIGLLNRRIRTHIATISEAQMGLVGARQDIKQLQEGIAADKLQLEQAEYAAKQEAQRVGELQEHLSLFNKQLSEGNQVLAPHLAPGGQVLPAADNLETEGLWQHYSAGVKQLIERLRTEQQSKTVLQQALRTETDKLVEKNRELAALQARLDTQAQQFAQFELIIAEHKTQLKQQENAEQRLSETQQQHQADLARLAQLEQQALDWTNTPRIQVQQEEKPETQEVLSDQPEQVPPVEPRPIQPQPALIEEKPQPAQSEEEPQVVEQSFTPEQHKEQPEMNVKASSGDAAGSKFNKFFTSAKEKIEKLDGKFTGQSNPVKEQEHNSEAVRGTEEPEAVRVEAPAEKSQAVSSNESQTTSTAKPAFDVSQRMKSLFAGPKGKGASADQEKAKAGAPKAEPSSGEQVEQSADASKKATSKLKNLFGKFK